MYTYYMSVLYTVQTNIRLWQNLGDVPGLKFSETLPYQSKFLTWLVEIQNAPALLIASESLIPAQTLSAKEDNFVTHLGIWKGVKKISVFFRAFPKQGINFV